LSGQMDKKYDPTKVEEKWYDFWETAKLFQADAKTARKSFTIVIPPPNVTGILHMGHALNNTIQDILIRSRRMRGFETLWIPGVDHAGIATQNVVEKKLATEGKDRHQLGREALLKEVWAWKNDRESTIVNQLKKIGCACDWSRYRFTMDERLSAAVARVFTTLFRKGLIYRGNYIINWCPRCQTALSDEEAEHQPVSGRLYHIRYPFESGEGHIIVATTRPETMLGDTAVAVNPKDERYAKLVGKQLELPLVARSIPIIADIHVDPKFGTGLVKVTPAHDPNDFEIGNRHGLPRVNVMAADGTMNDQAGSYQGLDRFECRKKVVSDLEALGLLEKVEDHQHAVGHCYRCDTMVEPYLSTQWFVSMKKLAAPAIKAVKQGRVRFHPDRWTAIYFNWLENIRDWCISRQIWWGHRIPVWYCEDCNEVNVDEKAPESCSSCGGNSLRQDEDVLDTWFSSQLWPFSTLGWPEKTEDLERFYPTSVLSTAPDIIFFWVARMIMAGLEFMDEVPFEDVYLHGVVRDETGRAMSKSRGNTIDPLEVIDEFGADAMRFTLISIAATGTDLYLSREKFHLGRNFANKLWNASRFVLMNFPEDFAPQQEEAPEFSEDELAERWILSRLHTCATEVTGALDAFRINDAAGVIYNFIWHDYCDWFIELSKLRIEQSGEAAKRTRWVLWHVLESSLRLLHPFMPYITEEIWQRLPHQGESIYNRPWLEVVEDMAEPEAEKRMSLLQDVVTSIRTIRSEMNVPPSKYAELAIIPADENMRQVVSSYGEMIKSLAKLEKISEIDEQGKPSASGIAVVGATELFVPLKGLIDLERERARLEKEVTRLRGVLEGLEKKLANRKFLENAPADIIEKDRQKESSYRETLTRLVKNLDQLAD
jgi:valyl-tRNA synthetase